MQAYLSLIVSSLNWFPNLKTKAGAVGALILAIIAAWNAAAPQIGVDFIIHVPDWINASVLAVLGIGAANQPNNLKSN